MLVRLLTGLVETRKVGRDELLAAPVRRILVIRQHHQMGDMLLAVPAFRAIKETFPGVRIGVVASRLNGGVLANNPYVDEVFVFDKKNPAGHVRLVRRLRAERFDLAIVLHTSSFSFTSVLLAFLSGATFRVGSTSKPFGHSLSKAFFHFELPLPSREALEGMSETEHNLYPLAALGIRTDDLAPVFVPSAADAAWADGVAAEFVKDGCILLAVHPGAGKRENIWGAERFAEVADRIGKLATARVLLVEGPRDREEAAEFARKCSLDIRVVRNETIGRVAAILKRSDLVLCNDTGVMHLAAAAGARTLAVFGPTDPSRWAPRCGNLHFVRAPEGILRELDARTVFVEAARLLDLELGAEGYS
jgi:heptosyltransferase-2